MAAGCGNRGSSRVPFRVPSRFLSVYRLERRGGKGRLLFGQGCFIEGVGERDLLHECAFRVLYHLGVDEEGDGHLHPFAGLQHLFGEAEAGDLVEIAARGFGGDVEAGGAGDRAVGGVVRLVEGKDVLADALVATGVRSVSGSIIGDESRYDKERFTPTLGLGIRTTEVGPLGSLMINDGVVTGNPIKPDNPALAAAQEFTNILISKGIAVSGAASVGVEPLPLAWQVRQASLLTWVFQLSPCGVAGLAAL